MAELVDIDNPRAMARRLRMRLRSEPKLRESLAVRAAVIGSGSFSYRTVVAQFYEAIIAGTPRTDARQPIDRQPILGKRVTESF